MAVGVRALYPIKTEVERFSQIKRASPGKEGAGFIVAKNPGRQMEMEFIDKPGLKQRQPEAAPAFAQDIGAAFFLSQVLERFAQITAAVLLPLPETKDARPEFAQRRGPRRCRSGRGWEQDGFARPLPEQAKHLRA